MNDPHVESLTYRMEAGKHVTFNSPPPLEGEADAFRYRLADGALLVSMKDHHPTEESARLVVDQFLRSWEIDAELRLGPQPMRFVFQRSRIIDRDPRPRTAYVMVARGGCAIGGSATFTVGLPNYPVPAQRFPRRRRRPDHVAAATRGFARGRSRCCRWLTPA